MIKFVRPARKRSARRQRRLALMRARWPTIQPERRSRDERTRAWKEERDFARNSERCYPGLARVTRETVVLAVEESDRSGRRVVDPIALACRAMERYLTGEYVGPLVRDDAIFVNPPFSQEKMSQ
jgi:hypothetical protein